MDFDEVLDFENGDDFDQVSWLFLFDLFTNLVLFFFYLFVLKFNMVFKS